MSYQRIHDQGQDLFKLDPKGSPFSRFAFLYMFGAGSFYLRNAVVPVDQKSAGCVTVQHRGTKLNHAYRLKKRSLSADISLNVMGYQDESVRFLLLFDNQGRQHTRGYKI
jgi:hypothetical protein